MIGSVLGIYEIVRDIGVGGFGAVYFAFNRRSKEMVAIKVLNSRFSAHAEFKERLWSEARLLRGLPTHPNIVKLLDFGETAGRPYLVMPYLPGDDLRDALDEGPLPLRRAVNIAAQVASALTAAAGAGVVHCDIKPENIRLPPAERPADPVLVMDFGIARALDVTARQSIGTPAYMAPEIWQGEPPQPATDIYALGCVLYEMLLGTPPFSGALGNDHQATPMELRQLHLTAEPDWEPFRDLNVPPALRCLLQKMLAKAPADRPTAEAISRTLRQLEPAIPADARLSKQSGRVTEDDTIPLDITRSDRGMLPELQTPAKPTSDHIPVGARVHFQRHFANVPLETVACRAALIHRGALFVGDANGNLYCVDLQYGRVQRWPIAERTAVHSLVWSLIARDERLLLHTGGPTWLMLDIQSGQISRRGVLPEAGMAFLSAGDCIYMIGADLYQTDWHHLDRCERFKLGRRLTGLPLVLYDHLWAPTQEGLVALDIHSRQMHRVGPGEPARAISALKTNLCAVSYSIVTNAGEQHTVIRLFDLAEFPPTLLSEAQAPGQSAGALAVSQQHVFLTCRDGHVWSWEIRTVQGKPSLQFVWKYPDGKPSSGAQTPAVYKGGLLAFVTGTRARNVLVMNAANGELVFQENLAKDVFIHPLWWERIMCLILSDGMIEMFRATVTAEDSA